ncbi:FAD-dependent oxidoreductase [Ktedonobacter racemifer]|uniref:FAD-dependent oxidoreductase n=1 Tax=Ktedonobacter racemifer TaxID=363277 RepID=UPI00058E6651|nr:FAD-dependent oxidoreductase [Ktedonobacter racemifer]
MQHANVAIIGAGIVGLATAYALLRAGIKNVYVLEQYTVDHARATSRGPSRLLRFEYGSDTLYPRMVQQSLQAWRHLERHSRSTLYTRTGVLVLGQEEDNYTLPAYHVLQEQGIPIDLLSQDDCHMLFPQFNTHGYDRFTYNVDAGLLHASTCLQTLKQLILDMGGKIIGNCRVTHIINENSRLPIRLLLENGHDLLTERVALTTGPWIQHILGDLRLPITTTRQYVLYFTDVPSTAFALHTFPAFIADDLYGFPLHTTNTRGYSSTWLKATSHAFGTPIDPDMPPAIEQSIVAQIAQKVRILLPALQDAHLAHIDTCMYDVSPDEDFILDYHPRDTRIVFATGLTGHGFKFGPLLGEILGALLYQQAPSITLERFRLARFSAYPLEQASSVA